jgi:hypothetical protein
VTKEPYKPLFIDLTQICPDILRNRGDISAVEQVFYIPNETNAELLTMRLSCAG